MMKNAEERLKRKQEKQAIKDQNNPNFDPKAEVHYNPNSNDVASSEDEQDEADDFEVNWDDFNAEPEEDRIHLSDDGIDKIKSFMLDMPKLNNVPKWAGTVEEDVWKTKLLESLEHKNNEQKASRGHEGDQNQSEDIKIDQNELVSSNSSENTTATIDVNSPNAELVSHEMQSSSATVRTPNEKDKSQRAKPKSKHRGKGRNHKHRSKGKSKGKGGKHKSKKSRK